MLTDTFGYYKAFEAFKKGTKKLNKHRYLQSSLLTWSPEDGYARPPNEDQKEIRKLITNNINQTWLYVWDSKLFIPFLQGTTETEQKILVDQATRFKEPQFWLFSDAFGLDQKSIKDDAQKLELSERVVSAYLIIPDKEYDFFTMVLQPPGHILDEANNYFQRGYISKDELISTIQPKLLCIAIEIGRFAHELLASIYLAKSFMNSTLCSIEKQPLPRPTKRLLQKKTGHEPPEVSFVRLRKKEGGSAGPSLEKSPTEWSCRWIVRGHYREQWYPSEGKHERIWINPYVKGPEELPLKTDTKLAFVVDR